MYFFLEVYAKDGYQHHEQEVDKSYGYQIFPFEAQQLVDTQTGERPLEPHDDKHHHQDDVQQQQETNQSSTPSRTDVYNFLIL